MENAVGDCFHVSPKPFLLSVSFSCKADFYGNQTLFWVYADYL